MVLGLRERMELQGTAGIPGVIILPGRAFGLEIPFVSVPRGNDADDQALFAGIDKAAAGESTGIQGIIRGNFPLPAVWGQKTVVLPGRIGLGGVEKIRCFPDAEEAGRCWRVDQRAGAVKRRMDNPVDQVVRCAVCDASTASDVLILFGAQYHMPDPGVILPKPWILPDAILIDCRIWRNGWPCAFPGAHRRGGDGVAYFVFACIEQVKAVWVGDDGGGLSMDAQGMLREMHAVICGKKEEAVLLSFDKEIVEISGAYGIQTVLIKEGRGGGKKCAFGDIMKSHITSLQCRVGWCRIHLNMIIA